MSLATAFGLVALTLPSAPGVSNGISDGELDVLEPIDVFQLEYASDPRISPEGLRVVYVRNFMDIMQDRRRSNLWIVDFDGSRHRPLTTGVANDSAPRWSPDGLRLAYVSVSSGSAQIHVRWMDTGQTAQVTHLTQSPGALSWSPDGTQLAFTMRVPEQTEPLAEMPAKPEGAEWAPPAEVIRKLIYRADGQGFLKDGYRQVFVVPADGGSPRQITEGPYDHGAGLTWSRDGSALLFSANRREDRDLEPLDSEIYQVSLEDGALRALTDRRGPDGNPVLSPDGSRVAYLGFDDRYQGYQLRQLYVMNRDGSDSRVVSGGLDRSVSAPVWDADGAGLYFQYDDLGNTKLAHVTLAGELSIQASDLGGTTIGRPYASGSFSVARNGRFAFTHTTPERPGDVAVGGAGGEVRLVTRLNDDLMGHKTLGATEELWVESSHDGRRVQGWVVTPPGYDASRSYPMVLEIHGGPFANYGDRFSVEVQLYAAAGFVVLYMNPRGSTSYGQEFGNLIHHAYPGYDYEDLMTGVDALIAKGVADPDRLYVTGGSGGGVLTSWIVGKTGRFQAAVVAKPVINWTSFVLTSDSYNFYYRYWFPGPPWEYPEHYNARSPLFLVGNVTTPTMVLQGDQDWRTPISESEQYYQALKLRQVDTAFVRIPGASHGIAARPSNLITKVVHILAWFDSHPTGQ